MRRVSLRKRTSPDGTLLSARCQAETFQVRPRYVGFTSDIGPLLPRLVRLLGAPESDGPRGKSLNVLVAAPLPTENEDESCARWNR
jgi:hypothetical protein